MKSILLASTMMLAFIGNAQTAEITQWTGRNVAGAPAFYVGIKGEIVPDDAAKFIKTVELLPRAFIVLESEGGNIAAALAIGGVIHAREFATVVYSDKTCMSACGVIWLAGRWRFVGTNAHIGFHAVHLDNKDKPISSVGNAMVGAFLGKFGLSYDAIRFVTEAEPSTMQWLTAEKAKELGIAATTLKPSTPQ